MSKQQEHPEQYYDIHTFNRLPRPESFQCDTLAFNNLTELKAAFPYVFKPNRAVALHPRTENAYHDPGHPVKDKKVRWLIKFSLCDDFSGQSANITKSIFIVTINQESLLSLWQYVPDNESNKASGIFPVPFTDSHHNYFYLYQQQHSPALRNERFELTYANSYCDAEQVVILRLNTPYYEHLIKMDFSGRSTGVTYHSDYWPVNKNGQLNLCRQIGGWGEGKKLFWSGVKNTVLEDSSHSKKIHEIPSPNNLPNTRIWTAAKDNDYLVVGGDEASVWVLNSDGKTFHDLDQQHFIKGYVRSVELAPLPPELSKQYQTQYLILVGCDDYYFYILDTAGNLLQKVNMQGLVDGLLYLNNASKEGADVAVLIRNKGIYCLRILYDVLNFKGYRKPLDKPFLNSLQSLKQLQAASLDNTLAKWLESPEPQYNLLAILYIVKLSHKLRIELFTENKTLFFQLNTVSVDYLKHFLFKKLQKLLHQPIESAIEQFRYYSVLLQCLADADNPLHVRAIVRSMLGWLQLLRVESDLNATDIAGQPLNETTIYERSLDTLLEKALDAKRELRYLAEEIIKLSDKTEQRLDHIVKFLAIEYHLQNSHLFSEEIIFPKQSAGQVDSVAIVGVGVTTSQGGIPERSNQVYIRRGEPQLSAFKLEQTAPFVKIGIQPHYQNVLIADDSQQLPPDVRVLLPLKADKRDLLVITSHKIGIARQSENAVEWIDLESMEINPSPFWSAVAYQIPDDTERFIVAVAGEWRLGSHEEIIYGFIINGNNLTIEKKLPENFFVKPDKSWHEALRFRDLMWDTEGNLWGITGDKGYLFRWHNVMAVMSHTANKTQLEQVVAIGVPQNAVLLLEKTVICGGHDGVLRAFDFKGRLVWATLVPGIIRKIGTASSLLANRKSLFAAIAVITDDGDLLLYTEHGKLKGELEIPNLPLTTLYSGVLKTTGNQHHLIGAMPGEVRLAEEVPEGWQAEDYFDNSKSQSIQTEIHKWREQAQEIQVIKRYFTPELAYKEPFIAAWAACQLLAQAENQHYQLVLETLKKISHRQLQIPMLQKMQMYIFSQLGEKIDDIPSHCIGTLIKQLEKLDDKALAAFLSAIPNTANNSLLIAKVLAMAWEKIKTSEYVFTSSALLQQFHQSQDEIYILNALQYKQAPNNPLAGVYSEIQAADNLDKDTQPTNTLNRIDLHANKLLPGYVEGMLAILFDILHPPTSKKAFSILFCLSKINSKFKNLAKILLSEKNHAASVIFHHWLDLHNETVFAKTDAEFWRQLSPILLLPKNQVFDAQKTLDSLRHLIRKADSPHSRDISALKNFLTLFPHSNLVSYEKVATHISDLPKRWHPYIDLTEKLRSEIERITLYAIEHKDIATSLDRLMAEIDNLTLKTPLFNNLHKAWQMQWKAELEHLRQEHIGNKPLEFSKEADLSPSIDIAVSRFFHAMQRVGFINGRFYRLVAMPGCEGLLELTCFNGQLKEGYNLPIKKIIDGQLLTYIKEFEQIKLKPRHFSYTVHHYKSEDDKDSGFQFWDKRINKDTEMPWLIIPVLAPPDQEKKQAYPKQNEVVGIFTFDADKIKQLIADDDVGFDRIVSTRILSVKNILLRIIGDVEEALTLEKAAKELKCFHILDQLDRKLFYQNRREIIEQNFLQTACELLGADGGMLLSHVKGLNQLAIRATEGASQEQLKAFRFDLTQEFFPIVKAWNQGKTLFIPNFQQSTEGKQLIENIHAGKVGFEGGLEVFRSWVMNIGSYVAAPIHSGTQQVGAISLQSQQPYQFDDNAHKALNFLVRRIRWFLHAIDTLDYKRMWERAVMHEVRSEATLITDSIITLHNYIDKNVEQAVYELNIAQAHCNQIEDLAQNFKAVQENPNIDLIDCFSFTFKVLDELLIFYNFKNYIVDYISLEKQLNEPIDLVGKKSDFTRILRNLLDNARKFGSRKLEADNEEPDEPFIILQNSFVDETSWQLKISNPGWMSETENAMKFTPYKGIHEEIKGQGFHIGLAASQIWANAYGGDITLENDNSTGKQHVVATLTWKVSDIAKSCLT